MGHKESNQANKQTKSQYLVMAHMIGCSKELSNSGVKFHCDTKTRNSIVVETIPSCIMEKDVNYVKSMRESVAWNIVQVRQCLD